MGGEIWVFMQPHAPRDAQLLYNNCAQMLLVVGAVNLWGQSGMKSRNAVIVSAVSCVYDVLFTSMLSMMATLFGHIDALPFAPTVE